MENLLSKKDKDVLRSGYKRRLLIIWCWLIIVALPVFAILAAPIYIAAGIKLSEIQDRNKVNESTNSDETTIFSLPELIDKKSETVTAYKNLKSAYDTFSSIMQAAPTGVSVEHVVFDRAKTKKLDEASVGGIAKDRESLSLYQRNLENLSSVADVVVPVESFSRPTNLSFSVDISLSTSTKPQ
jgi:hypothetical protein